MGNMASVEGLTRKTSKGSSMAKDIKALLVYALGVVSGHPNLLQQLVGCLRPQDDHLRKCLAAIRAEERKSSCVHNIP